MTLHSIGDAVITTDPEGVIRYLNPVAPPDVLDQLSMCSINTSGHSLGDAAFLEYVNGKFEKTRIPGGKICFEITETAAISNFASAGRLITDLKKRGCQFALDDFGNGLCSFAYLRAAVIFTMPFSACRGIAVPSPRSLLYRHT